MKTCLGILLLLPIIIAIVGTAVYHTSVNGELKFEPRDTNEEYINTNRSYRPPTPPKQAKPSAAPAQTTESVPDMPDDLVAEEVDQ